MKKLLSLLLAAIMVFSLAACNSANGSSQDASASDQTASEDPATTDTDEAEDAFNASVDPEFITVSTLDANGEKTEIKVLYNPERLAVMDLAVLDMLDNFGVGDRVVGVSKGSSIDYLQSYVTDDNIVNLGTIKEADLEAVMECEPDIIFIGGRLSSQYDVLSEIAPVVYIAADVEAGVVNSTKENAINIASIFGAQDTVSDLLAEYDGRIAALAEAAEGKTAVVGMVTSGGFNVLGNDGRCSIIGIEVGFENIGLKAAASSGRGGGGGNGGSSGSSDAEASGSSDAEASSSSNAESSGEGGTTATHGNEASFEVLVSLDPDYIVIMDRDAAIGTEGAQLAEEVMDNELVRMTSAYQNGNIIYLEHSNVWYTAEGGITALGIMLSDLENALL